MEKIKADLHNHLRTSDKIEPDYFNRAVDKTLENMGSSSAISIVNFADQRYEEFMGLKGYDRTYVGREKRAIYVPEKNILFIKGQEIPTKQGHVLVLGLPAGKHLKNGRTIEDTLAEARDHGAITVIDHPFYIGSAGYYIEKNQELLGEIDAIEIHNSEAACYSRPIPGFANRKAKSFYNRVLKTFPHLGALSSTDGHSFYEIGSSWVEITKPNLEDGSKFLASFKESIRGAKMDAKRENGNQYIGGVDHISDLMAYMLASKVPFLRGLIPQSRYRALRKNILNPSDSSPYE